MHTPVLLSQPRKDVSQAYPGTIIQVFISSVPGPPNGLEVIYNPQDCSSVNLRWSPPAEDEQHGKILF